LQQHDEGIGVPKRGLLKGSRQSCKAKNPPKWSANRVTQRKDANFGELADSAAVNTPGAKRFPNQPFQC